MNRDKTRTAYIITSLNSLERNDFIKDKFSIESAFINHLPKPILYDEPQQSCSTNHDEEAGSINVPSNDIDDKIQSVTTIFPHLGDGMLKPIFLCNIYFYKKSFPILLIFL